MYQLHVPLLLIFGQGCWQVNSSIFNYNSTQAWFSSILHIFSTGTHKTPWPDIYWDVDWCPSSAPVSRTYSTWWVWCSKNTSTFQTNAAHG